MSSVGLLGPQFTWTFYAHAGFCLCGVAPLFAPEKIVPLLAGGCDEAEYSGAAGPVLAAALQLYAALMVVQAKMLRHAASTPSDLKFHSALAQAQAVACALSVGAVIQAEGSGFFTRLRSLPLTGLFTLAAARYGGGLNRMRWAASAAPKDPKEEAMESEFQRGVFTDIFLLFPVPRLTRVFQAHAVFSLVCGVLAFAVPDVYVWAASPGQEAVGKCSTVILKLIIQLYGALTIGQFWLAWKAARLVQVATRKRLTESWAAMFTASTVIVVGAWRNGFVNNWVCMLSMLVFTVVALAYWICYVEPDVVPGCAQHSCTNGAAEKAKPVKAAERAKPGKAKRSQAGSCILKENWNE